MTDCERYKRALVAIAHPGRHPWSAEACQDIALEALEPIGDPESFHAIHVGVFGRQKAAEMQKG